MPNPPRGSAGKPPVGRGSVGKPPVGRGSVGNPGVGRASVGKPGAKKKPEPPSRRNVWIGAAGVVVLALVAYLVFRPRRENGVVVLVSPEPDAVLHTAEFVWRPYEGMSNYEIEIVTEEGEQVFATSTADTVARVRTDSFGAGKKYLWLVRGLVKGEAKALSHIDRFTYQP